MPQQRIVDDCNQEREAPAPAIDATDWAALHEWYEEETKLGGNGR